MRVVEQDRHAWVFMYGTLQPTSWNFHALSRAVSFTQRATTRGRLYRAYDDPGAYPAARFDGDDTIHGTVLLVNTISDEWLSVWAMERRAGYRLVVVDTDQSYEALAFEYVRGSVHTTGLPPGARISASVRRPMMS